MNEIRPADESLARAVEIAAANADKDRTVLRAHKLVLHRPPITDDRTPKGPTQ